MKKKRLIEELNNLKLKIKYPDLNDKFDFYVSYIMDIALKTNEKIDELINKILYEKEKPNN